MILNQPDAMLIAWWLKQKIKKFTVDAGMTALLRKMVDALEAGEKIEVLPGWGSLKEEESNES